MAIERRLVWALMSEYPQEGSGQVWRVYENEDRAREDRDIIGTHDCTKAWKLFQVPFFEEAAIVVVRRDAD